MYRNSLTLPLITLVLALAGAVVLAFDLSLKQQAEQAQALVVDGRIGEKEYENHLKPDDMQMDVYWTIRDDRIYIGLRAPSQGWLAIAVNPEGPQMKGGDIIIGYVKENQLFLQDSYAPEPTGHQADKELGGRDDILEKAGAEDQASTVIEFARKLDTGDQFDKPIRQGELSLIQVAYTSEDDFTSYHGSNWTLIPQIDFFKTRSQGSRTVSLGLVSHLEAYELGLIAWVAVLGIFAIQGIISVWLEGQELKANELSSPSESIGALLLTALLAVLELVWAVQFVRSLYGGAPPTIVALYAALLSFTLAAILLVYRRAFVSTETIVQARDDHIPW